MFVCSLVEQGDQGLSAIAQPNILTNRPIFVIVCSLNRTAHSSERRMPTMRERETEIARKRKRQKETLKLKRKTAIAAAAAKKGK